MPIATYLEWRRQAGVGCVFARLMANDQARYGQRIEVVAAGTPVDVAAKISTRVDHYIADASTSVLTLVIPHIKKLDALIEIVQAVGSLPEWNVAKVKLPKTAKNGPCLGFRVSRMIPFGSGACPSEALVLGHFKEFPKTRRAPVVALEIFVGEPLPKDPKTGLPTEKANLAHVPLPAATQSIFARVWINSKKGRRKSLGIKVPVKEDEDDEVPLKLDDLRAKAKIAFAVPMKLATKLGIKP